MCRILVKYSAGNNIETIYLLKLFSRIPFIYLARAHEVKLRIECRKFDDNERLFRNVESSRFCCC